MADPLLWRKASASAAQSDCVELADAGGAVLLRDSKHPASGHLSFTRAEMAALIDACRIGELDDLLS